MPELRVFDYVGRSMERLGFLKRLVKRVASTPTSNLEALGKDLVNTVTKKVHARLSTEIMNYMNSRVRVNRLKYSKEEVDAWSVQKSIPPEINLELQDLYLSDSTLPSQVGRLVEDNWRRYPAFGTNLGLVRKGTYSLNTRGVSFLSFISNKELGAFTDYYTDINPMRISIKQALLLLYSFIENDGEVIIPLWRSISSEVFNEKELGNLLPNIYRRIITRNRLNLLPIEIRERLNILEETARNVENVAKSDRSYGGTSPRETAIRPRLEPYVDIGLLNKPNPLSYEYTLSQIGNRWIENFTGDDESVSIRMFLDKSFFHNVAYAWMISARENLTRDEIIEYLRRAAGIIESTSGYTPIEELGLVAGIQALIEDKVLIEQEIAHQTLIEYQKLNPYKVRFTVDRQGNLANARFMESNNQL